MRFNLKYASLLVIYLIFTGCTVHIKPEKFDIDPKFTRNLSGNTPIQVVVPNNSEQKFLYLVEFSGAQTAHADVYVDLNDLHKNAKELIEEALVKSRVPLSTESAKFLKFTISKVQWEIWAGGFATGSYLEFDVETGDGYKRHFRVQDGSAAHVSRAVGGTISRAVEEIFQDEKILAYIKIE
jgi:hypothetical protein